MLKSNELFSQTPVDVIIQGSVSSGTQLINIKLNSLVFWRLVPAHDLDDSLHVLVVQSPKFSFSNINYPESASLSRNREGSGLTWFYYREHVFLPYSVVGTRWRFLNEGGSDRNFFQMGRNKIKQAWLLLFKDLKVRKMSRISQNKPQKGNFHLKIAFNSPFSAQNLWKRANLI